MLKQWFFFYDLARNYGDSISDSAAYADKRIVELAITVTDPYFYFHGFP